MIYRSKAPLRIGFAGGGSDLNTYCDKYGGLILNATITLFVHCTIEELSYEKIIFESLDTENIVEIKAAPILRYDGNLDLFKAIYNRIIREYKLDKLYFRLTTFSDVPSGSGLGGSSTLVVAIIKVFSEWLKLPLGDYDIAKLAYEIEREDIGIVGGSQDHYAATFGGFNFMEFYEKKRVIVNPLRIKDWIVDELEESTVLYFTKITRQASQIEKEKKNLLEDIKSLEAMHEVKADAILMKEFLLKGQIRNFADVLGKSWEAKKRVSNSISNDQINYIYDLAIRHGAYSGKVSGAGGGGFMFFLVDPRKKYDLITILNEQEGYVFDFHFTKYGTKGWKIDD